MDDILDLLPEGFTESAKELIDAFCKMVNAAMEAASALAEYATEKIDEAIAAALKEKDEYDHNPTIYCNSTEIRAPTIVRRPIPP